MDPICADVGRQFYFANDDRLFRQRGQTGKLARFRNRLRHVRLAWTNAAHATGRTTLVALLKNVFEHVHNFAGIGALEFDELAHNFRRRYVDLIDDSDQRANHA